MVRSSLSSFVFARFLFSPKLRRASRDTVCTCPKFRRSFVPSLFRGQAWNSSVTEFSNISSIRVRGAIAAYSTNQPVERIGCTLHHFFSFFLKWSVQLYILLKTFLSSCEMVRTNNRASIKINREARIAWKKESENSSEGLNLFFLFNTV